MIVAVIPNDINRMLSDVEEVFEDGDKPFISEQRVYFLINSLVSLYPHCFNKKDLFRLGVDSERFYKEAEERFFDDETTMKIIESSKNNMIRYTTFSEDEEIRFLEVI